MKVHFEIGSVHMARDARGLVLPRHAGVRRKEGSLCSNTQACVWGNRVKNLDYLLNPLEQLFFSSVFFLCLTDCFTGDTCGN